MLIAFNLALFAQTKSSVRGRVTDSLTKEPLAGATITIKESTVSSISDKDGYFYLSNLNTGNIILEISYVGYETLELNVKVERENTTNVNAAMNLSTRIGNEVVVAASKKAEKIVNAPASIHVIGKKELEQYAGSNVHELMSNIQGVEFVRSSVDFVALNARGFNSAGNNKFFQLVDGRNNMTAISTGLPLSNNGQVIKEDVGKIEIMLGPQSALYGPNVHNGLLYITTKDPRKYQGTTVSISAGNQYQFSARLRQAAKINNRWAYKFTGEYAAGKDFEFYDSVYAGNQNGLTPQFGPPVAIPERNVDFDFRHIRGQAHLYYSLTPKTDIIISGGGSNNNFIGVANGGRNQMRGVTTSFLQARIVHPEFFVNINNAWGNIGTSYSITSYTRDFWNTTHLPNPLPPDSAEKYAMRLGNQFKEENQRLNAEAQYNHTFPKAGIFLVGGMSYQKEKPNSFGVTLVDKDRRIYITQSGAVIQLEKSLPWNMRLIGAARFDNHSNFGNFFSPKIAWQIKAGDGNFRVTWGKAYAMPSIFYQYANFSGVTFGNGERLTYLPNGSYRESLPAIAVPLKPEEINTWEFGYKGTVAKKLYIDVNYYNGLSKNFLSPPLTVQGRAISLGDIPLTPAFPGQFVNDTLRGASFLTFFNYGDVRAYGLDLGLNYYFNKVINLAIRYSWFGSDITKDNVKNDANKDGYVSSEEKSLNAPKNRAVAILSFQNLCKQSMFVNLSARFVQQYDFYSGSQIGTEAGKGRRGQVPRPPLPPIVKNFDWGPLGGFTTIDLSAGYQLNQMVQLNMSITNLLNTNQIEFVGSPSIGRLIMFELKVHVPNKKD